MILVLPSLEGEVPVGMFREESRPVKSIPGRCAASAGRAHFPEESVDGVARRLQKVYAQRIAQYLQSPPPADWDGVYQFREK